MHRKPEIVHVAGRRFWDFGGGKVLPVVSGGDGPNLRTAEEEIADLRKRIQGEEQTEARLRSDADQILAEAQDLAEKGGDRFTREWMDKVDNAYKEPDGKRDDILAMRRHLERLLQRAGQRSDGPRFGPGAEERARRGDPIAQRFIESDVYQRLQSSGILRSEARVETSPVEVLDRGQLVDLLRQRATFDISQGGALIPVDQQVFPPIEIPVRQVRLLQLLNVGTTDSDVVKWSKQTVRTEAAVETPFGTAAPEGAYAYVNVQNNVQRIPVMVPATRDQLADQGQTQTLIEGQMRLDVLHRVENQVLAGAGGASNQLDGLTNSSGFNIVNTRDGSHSTEYDLDAAHRGITAIRLSLFSDPTAVGLHPINYEKIVLQKDTQGRYVYQPTGSEGPVSIWGLMPVISAVFTVGTAWVADFRRGYTLWVREGLAVTASDGYQSFFAEGRVAVLATMRAAGAVQQPRAFSQILGLPTS